MAEQRLIDAEALLIKLSRMIDYCKKDSKVNGLTALFQVGDAIMDCPTVDAKPVVHAHWALFGKDGTDTDYGCTNCGYTFTTSGDYPQSVHYCPYCGAQMDEEINNG